MSLLTLRDAIIAGLKANVPALTTVAKIDGNITNRDSIRRLSARAPAAFVAITGVSDVQKVGVATFNANATCAVFIMTAGQNRIEDYNNVVEAILLAVLENNWGLANTRYPMNVTSEVIFNDDIVQAKEKTLHYQNEGVLLAGIAWNQRTRIERTMRADDVAETEARGTNILTEELSVQVDLDGEIVIPANEVAP